MNKKQTGSFYTPLPIVEYMTKWSVKDGITVLEPSAGDGRFVSALLSAADDIDITAVEINPLACTLIEPGATIVNKDFYDFYEENNPSYDLVIGNPPYIKQQLLSKKNRDQQSKILTNNNLKDSQQVNAWMSFTVAAIELLKPGGKLSFVLPSDIFQVSYAKGLREMIFKEFSEVNLISFNNLVFPDIQQSVVLLMAIKRNKEKQTYIRNINIDSLDELPELDEIPKEEFTYTNSSKWRKYSLSSKALEFYNDSFKSKTQLFNNLAQAEVGVTTGSNKIFIVKEKTVKEYNLEDYAIPVITTDKYLLDFNNDDELTEGALEYISQFEKSGENDRYKLNIRKTWYKVPSIWIPEMFISRRIGKELKVIKNDISAISSDSFLRVKLEDSTDIDELVVLLYTSYSQLSMELEGRVFGGGLLELLPGDMSNIRLPNVIKEFNSKEILGEINNKLSKSQDIYQVVKWLDNKLKNNLEFSDEEQELSYNTWIKLNKKRN